MEAEEQEDTNRTYGHERSHMTELATDALVGRQGSCWLTELPNHPHKEAATLLKARNKPTAPLRNQSFNHTPCASHKSSTPKGTRAVFKAVTFGLIRNAHRNAHVNSHSTRERCSENTIPNLFA